MDKYVGMYSGSFYDLDREIRRERRKASKVYKTDRGMWMNQDSGSLECVSTTTGKLNDAIAEYQRSNDWN